MNRVSSNIWKYTLFLISNKRVWVAIIGAYYLSISGIEVKEIAYILLAGNIAGFLFEIPSGYLSDKIGHRRTLIASRILMLLSSLFYLFAPNLLGLILASILMSLSLAFTSGTGSVFLQESLKSLGRENEYAKISGRVKSISFAVPLILSSLVPLLVEVSLRAPFVISVIMDLVGLFAALSFVDPEVKEGKIKEIGHTNFKDILAEGKLLGFNKLALLSGTLFGMIMAFGMFRSPYQKELLVPMAYMGIFFGTGRLLASFLLAKSGVIKEKTSINSFYMFQIVFFLVVLVILGLTQSVWIVVAVFMIQNGVKWGLSQIEIAYLMESIKVSKNKATLLSVKAQIGQISTGVSGFILGYLISGFGYMDSFLTFGCIFLVTAFVLYRNAFRKVRVG